jgi:hypothetical protein
MNHTDSMVTVPLSSNSEDTQPEWRTLEIPQTPVDSTAYADDETDPKATPTSAKPDLQSELARSRISEDVDRTEGDGVDWEELEKTEEQEPRMEGSDEVGNHPDGKQQDSTDVLDNCPFVSSPGARE